MRITENRLRRVIRSVISESSMGDANPHRIRGIPPLANDIMSNDYIDPKSAARMIQTVLKLIEEGGSGKFNAMCTELGTLLGDEKQAKKLCDMLIKFSQER